MLSAVTDNITNDFQWSRTMKLAEALILRSDMQKTVEELKERLFNNAKVQEGDTPGENPMDLMGELERVTDELVSIVQRINRTNVKTLLNTEMTLADALAVRDILKSKHSIYRELAYSATTSPKRLTRSEIKFISSVNIKEVQDKADLLAKQHRELDASIQGINWSTDLLD
jgi:hypothetical protein